MQDSVFTKCQGKQLERERRWEEKRERVSERTGKSTSLEQNNEKKIYQRKKKKKKRPSERREGDRGVR